MNNRIKELAEQAFFDESTSLPSTKMYTFSDHKMQRFAELIVRECADIVEETRWMVPPSQEQIARSIKQHFGVNE